MSATLSAGDAAALRASLRSSQLLQSASHAAATAARRRASAVEARLTAAESRLRAAGLGADGGGGGSSSSAAAAAAAQPALRAEEGGGARGGGGLAAAEAGAVDASVATERAAGAAGGGGGGAALALKRIGELESQLAAAKADVGEKVGQVQRAEAAAGCARAEAEELRREVVGLRDVVEAGGKKLDGGRLVIEEHERTIATLSKQVRSKTDEAADLASQIAGDLIPALDASREDARRKAAEVAANGVQLAELRATTDKTRSLLEQDVASTSSRLESTRLALESTQARLSSSEERGQELDQSIVRLVADVKSRDATIATLQEDLRHRRCALEAIQGRLAEVELTVAGKEQAAADAKNELEAVAVDRASVRNRVDVAEARAARRDSDFVELEARRASVEAEHEALNAAHHHGQAALAAQTEKAEELGALVALRAAALEDQARLARQREALFDNLSAELRSTISSRDGQINVLKTEAAATQKQMAQLAEKLAETEGALEETKETLALRCANLDDARAEVRDMCATLAEKEAELSRLRTELESKVEDVSSRDGRISCQGRTIADQEGKIAGMRAESIASERLVDKLHADIVALEDKLEGRRKQVEEMTADISTLNGVVADGVVAAADGAQEMSLLRGKLETVERELVEQSKTIDDRKNEVAKLEAVCASHLETIERSKHEFSMLESHLEGHDTLMREYHATQETLDLRSKELGQLREEFANVTSDRSKVKSLLQEKSDELAVLSARVAYLVGAKASLEAKLASMGEARDVAENAARESSASLAAVEAESSRAVSKCQATIEELRSTAASNASASKGQIEALATMRDHDRQELLRVRADLEAKAVVLQRVEGELDESQETLQVQTEALERLKRELASQREISERLAATAEAASASSIVSTTGPALSSSSMSDKDSIADGDMAAKLVAKDKAVANLHDWCCFLNEKLEEAEKSLSLREAELQVSSNAFQKLSASDGPSAVKISTTPVSPATSPKDGLACLLADVKQGEAAVTAAREEAASWRRKYEEIRPVAEEAQRTAEALRIRLDMTEKETIQRVDVVSLELASCRADRDLAERECAAAVGDNAALRARLADAQKTTTGSSSSLSSLRSAATSTEASLCRVTFSLDGLSVPGEDVSVSVVGSDSMLGSWELGARQPMRPTRNSSNQVVWKCQVLLSAGTTIDYKFVADIGGSTVWEDGENRCIDLAGAGSIAHVQGRWRGAQ